MYLLPQSVLLSRPFTFRVGEKLTPITVPSLLLSRLSKPIDSLMNSGMIETTDGSANLPEVALEVFVAVCEFAYSGTYQNPTEVLDFHDEQFENIMNPSPGDVELEKFPILGYLRELDVHRAREQRDIEAARYKPRGKKTSRRSECPYCDIESPTETLQPSTAARLWQDFLNGNEAWRGQREQRPPNILFHAQVYAFAEEKLIEPLCACSVHHLRRELSEYDLDVTTASDIFRLLHFAYAHRSRSSSAGEDRLRKLVVLYAASKLEVLLTMDGFRPLLDHFGELGSDLIWRLHT